jgi:chaperonin GroEL (HSP60 family)
MALYGNGRFYDAPYKQICENAGKEIEIPEIVIDSFRTVKYSLLNALSTATSILTAEAAMIKEKDDD